MDGVPPVFGRRLNKRGEGMRGWRMSTFKEASAEVVINAPIEVSVVNAVCQQFCLNSHFSPTFTNTATYLVSYFSDSSS